MSEVSFTRPVGWSAGRIRRTRLFAVTAVLAVGLGLFALSMPWYAFSVAGPARCTLGLHPQAVTVVSPDSVRVPGVIGAGCISGYQTVHQDEMLAASGVSAQSSAFGAAATAAAPDAQFGLPATAFFLTLGGLLVAAAMMLRNGFPGLLGLLVLTVSWNAFGSLQQTMTWGAAGQLNQPQSGLSVYGFALTFLVATSVVGCGWVAWLNHKARAEVKRAARAEGREHELPPSFLDHLAASALRVAQQKAEKVIESRTPAKSGASR